MFIITIAKHNELACSRFRFRQYVIYAQQPPPFNQPKYIKLCSIFNVIILPHNTRDPQRVSILLKKVQLHNNKFFIAKRNCSSTQIL